MEEGTPEEILRYNRATWDAAVRDGSEWTIGVSPEQVARARAGDWQIGLTTRKPVPADWFPPMPGCDVLCLAGAGGQQGPILAAAGANVTVYDNSPAQLQRDEEVARREGLAIHTVQGDMAKLDALADASFDFIVHPVSNCFVPHILPVWREAFRVLRPGGAMIAGFCNPDTFIFDPFRADNGEMVVRFPLPYADLKDLTPDELAILRRNEQPFEWSHTLTEQIGGQLAAGFHITGFYEDKWVDEDSTTPIENPLDEYFYFFMATRAWKPDF